MVFGSFTPQLFHIIGYITDTTHDIVPITTKLTSSTDLYYFESECFNANSRILTDTVLPRKRVFISNLVTYLRNINRVDLIPSRMMEVDDCYVTTEDMALVTSIMDDLLQKNPNVSVDDVMNSMKKYIVKYQNCYH